MPPAPTTPRTVEARTLNSHQKRPTDTMLGATSGSSANASTFRREAPVTAAPSSGPPDRLARALQPHLQLVHRGRPRLAGPRRHLRQTTEKLRRIDLREMPARGVERGE